MLVSLIIQEGATKILMSFIPITGIVKNIDASWPFVFWFFTYLRKIIVIKRPNWPTRLASVNT